ncbi:MAG TPA: phosphatidate cytidylyltransferase [Candidatus Angelobacter sp.]|nr:phosphatidate cytidylyltransferase [Candidatus Angelobacter sp.]
MKRVLTAVVLIPLVLLAVFRAPLWLFAVLVGAIIVLALREYLSIAEAAGLKPFKWLTFIMGVLPFILWWDNGSPVERQFNKISFDLLFLQNWLLVLLAAAVVFGVPLVFRKDLRSGLASVAASLFGLIYIAVSLSFLICFRADNSGKILVIFVLLSVWAGDIAAYYVGRSIGKHKLAPVVSPNKSWEGAIASVLGSVGFAALVFHFQPQIEKFFLVPPSAGQASWIHVIALGIITNVAAQLGDLFESAIKRGANIKDSGSIVPGHGGILDRIDALLFAIPVVWYYATLTGFLHPKS